MDDDGVCSDERSATDTVIGHLRDDCAAGDDRLDEPSDDKFYELAVQRFQFGDCYGCHSGK
jgi:hypothetical protein